MYEQISLTTAGGPGDDTISLSMMLVSAVMDYRYGFANAIGVIMFTLGIIILLVVNRLLKMNESVY